MSDPTQPTTCPTCGSEMREWTVCGGKPPERIWQCPSCGTTRPAGWTGDAAPAPRPADGAAMSESPKKYHGLTSLSPWVCPDCGTTVRSCTYHDCKGGTVVNPPPTPQLVDVLRADVARLTAERDAAVRRAEAAERLMEALIREANMDYDDAASADVEAARAAWLAARSPQPPAVAAAGEAKA